MVKLTWYARFKPGLDREDARRRWREDHGPMCLEVPGIRRYVQSHVVTAATNEGTIEAPSAFDGSSSAWWESRAELEDALRSPEWARLQEDGEDLFDLDWTFSGMAAEIEERVKRVGMGASNDGVSTPPGRPVKLVGLLTYRSDMTRGEANEYWATHHGDLALRITEMGHYVQNHAIRPIGESGEELSERGFDGYSEAWFEDQATYERAMASEAWQGLVDDGPNLFDMSVFKSGIVEEHVLRG